MNLGLALVLGVGGIWLYRSSREPGSRVAPGANGQRAVVKGGRYVAVYSIPPGFPVTDEASLDKLSGILPPGSSVEIDGAKLVITMTAVSDQQIGDIPTPLGTFILVSLRRLSEVVSGVGEGEKLPTVMSWWNRDPKIGLVWSGYTKPIPMTVAQANSAVAKSPVSRIGLNQYRWTGKSWSRIY